MASDISTTSARSSAGRRRDVVVVGAGPYGLSAAAFLREAGADVAVFGELMGFWKRGMPRGMLLRSPWPASTIADPGKRFTLDQYERLQPRPLARPVPLDDFVAYATWFAENAVPDLDERRVRLVEAANPGFRVTLEDGEQVLAERVVVAAGLARFARRPEVVASLPSTAVSHSSEHPDLAAFSGQRVLVVGGGQSAIESAALLHEQGADVEVVVRAPGVHWLGRSARLHRIRVTRRLLYAPSDVGPAGVSWVVHSPRAFRRFPASTQAWMTIRSLRPAASAWLIPRTADIPISTGRAITRAAVLDGRVRIELDDGSSRVVDHVLLGTGYRVDVTRYAFLAPELVSSLVLEDGYPLLGADLSSSVPGLHFAGATAGRALGPLTRFVAGTRSASQALLRGVSHGRRA